MFTNYKYFCSISLLRSLLHEIRQNCRFFGNCQRNTTASMETFTEKYLGHYSALHIISYLSITLSKILSHSKTIKNAKKLQVFSESESRRLSNFLQTHIF